MVLRHLSEHTPTVWVADKVEQIVRVPLVAVAEVLATLLVIPQEHQDKVLLVARHGMEIALLAVEAVVVVEP